MLTILIPTYNEEKNIERVVKNIANTLKGNAIQGEILVVDDSTDRTYDILKKLSKENKYLRVIHRDKERGAGTAVKVGIENAKYKYFIIMMGDGCDDVNSIPNILKKLEEGYDVVIGSRFMKGGELVGYSKIKLLANRLTNILIRLLFRIEANDVTYLTKGFNKRILEGVKLEAEWFDIGVEMTIKSIKKGGKYYQIPVKMYQGDSNQATFGSSLRNLYKFGRMYLGTILRLYFS